MAGADWFEAPRTLRSPSLSVPFPMPGPWSRLLAPSRKTFFLCAFPFLTILAIPAPSQAQTSQECVINSSGILVIASTSGTPTTTPCTSATILDKLYDNFQYTNFVTGDLFTFEELQGFYSVTVNPAGVFQGKTSTFSYDVTILEQNNFFQEVSRNANCTVGSGSCTVTSVITPLLPPGWPLPPLVSLNGTPDDLILPEDLKKINISSTFTATNTAGTNLRDATLTLSQYTEIPPVPGPFPLLGAGAAVGFSRTLRRRVREATHGQTSRS